MLPNFLIIGAARSGTTSIYHSLSEHPDVFMCPYKEPSFFSKHWVRGLNWYQSFFTTYAGQKAIGEASVDYTFPEYPDTPARIASVLPNVRLIYILRNPVERTYSHYLYRHFFRGRRLLDFEEALQTEPRYLGASCYYVWIERYLKHFKSEQICVLLFEDYVTDPVGTLRKIFEFIGVDHTFIPASAGVKTNTTFKPRNELAYRTYRRCFASSRLRFFLEALLPQSLRPVMRNWVHRLVGSQEQLPTLSASAASRLREYFRTDIENLADFLRRDLSIWQ